MRPRLKAHCRAFTLIELLIVIAVIAILASIAMPSMLSSRKAANEASAVASLRQIASAQETYRVRHSPPAYGVLSDLGGTDLLDPLIVAGYKGGYTFTVSGDTWTYTATATPSLNAGNRHFYVDHTGVVRYAVDGPATANSTPIQ